MLDVKQPLSSDRDCKGALCRLNVTADYSIVALQNHQPHRAGAVYQSISLPVCRLRGARVGAASNPRRPKFTISTAGGWGAYGELAAVSSPPSPGALVCADGNGRQTSTDSLRAKRHTPWRPLQARTWYEERLRLVEWEVGEVSGVPSGRSCAPRVRRYDTCCAAARFF